MKTLIFALVLTASSAHASFFATNCSDSFGKVTWQEGQMSNVVTIKYINNAGKEVTKKFNRFDLDIKLSNQKTLVNETVDDCKKSPIFSKTQIYAAKAVITPAQGAAVDMKMGDKVEAYVICHHHMNSMMACPNH